MKAKTFRRRLNSVARLKATDVADNDSSGMGSERKRGKFEGNTEESLRTQLRSPILYH